MCALFFVVKMFVTLNSWFVFLAVCLGIGIVGYIISVFLIFNKEELGKLSKGVLKKIKR